MDYNGLNETARAIVVEGKGLLAADESTGTIKKRLNAVDVESTEGTRRAYRDLLFTTPEMDRYISGVILYDETIRQATGDGTPFPKYLADRGVIPGIKVDKGAKPLAGHDGEKVTEGLDGLRERFSEYADMGAKFAKWRAVITIGDAIPSDACIRANAHALARYATLSQEAGIAPIVEPEVLMNGAHDIDRCALETGRTLKAVFDALVEQGVYLEGMLLKPNMVVSGEDCPRQASVDEVARATLRTLNRFVPAAVPGIVFLSGGQGAEVATEHLNAMHKLGPQPWSLSFSYGRALQAPALEAWGGRESNVGAAKEAFRHRAELNSAATRGAYNSEMETQAAA
jgi:fructose-bisphosphate aldolase class I